MRSLKELYELNLDVKESEIPTEFKENFHNFIIGSTCIADYNDKGDFIEFVYYSCDFRIWYNINRKVIERNYKIDIIVK